MASSLAQPLERRASSVHLLLYRILTYSLDFGFQNRVFGGGGGVAMAIEEWVYMSRGGVSMLGGEDRH
jgi:hypothetical protein